MVITLIRILAIALAALVVLLLLRRWVAGADPRVRYYFSRGGGNLLALYLLRRVLPVLARVLRAFFFRS